MTNVITIRLSMAGDYIDASWFALGILVAEVIYAKICLVVVNRMFKYEFIGRILQWLVLLILIFMATMSFIASGKAHVRSAFDLIGGELHPFIFGFLIMAINPVQIPFWLGWMTILSDKKILLSNQHGQTRFLLGIGLGSLAASALFIVSGQWLFSFLVTKERLLHFIFGCVFAIMAWMQAGRLFGVKRRIKQF